MQSGQQKQHRTHCAGFSGSAACLWGLNNVEQVLNNVDQVLQTLEDQDSLLTGMFREFVKDAHLMTTISAGASRTPAAGRSTAEGPRPAPASTHQHQQQQHQQQQQQQQHVCPEQRQGHHTSMKRPRATELPLNVTLEELFRGTTKQVPVQLRRQDARSGMAQTVTTQLQVRVQPGLHAGTRITLPGLGNLDQQGQHSDLTFVLQQQLHPAFRRLADDLYAIVNVPLVTALTGGPVELQTLGGELLQLPLAENTIITPNSQLVVQDQGMPIWGRTGKRGSLHVRFHVRFPQQLTSTQQQLLRQALAEAEELQHMQCAPVNIAAAVATAAGLGPRPNAGLPLLPPSPSTAQHQHGLQEPRLVQQQQGTMEPKQQQGQVQSEQQQQQQLAHTTQLAAAGNACRADSSCVTAATAAAVAASHASASSQGTWAAAAGAGSTACLYTKPSPFTALGAGGASSGVSSSSAGGFAACMQSTGSSREPL